jgi:hypothetical protein
MFLVSETEKLVQVLEAEARTNVSTIMMQKDVLMQEGNQKVQMIQSNLLYTPRRWYQ